MPDGVKEIWRNVALILATALLTGAGGWFLQGRNMVTRDELNAALSELKTLIGEVRQAQPANVNRSELATQLADIKAELRTLREAQPEGQRRLGAIEAQLKILLDDRR